MSFSASVEKLVELSSSSLIGAASWWARVPLSLVAEITNGYPWKSIHFNDEEGVPVIRIRDVTSGKTDTFYRGKVEDGFWIENGDFLIGMDGDFNSRIWEGGKALLNQRVCRVKTNEKFYLKEFLAYVLPGYLQLINDDTHSVTVKHLSSKTLAEIPLPLPSFPEQLRIVAKLDTLSARSRRAREHLDHVPRLVEKYKQAVLASVFDALKDLAILKPLDEVASVITSGSRDWSQYYDRGGSVFVLAGNIRPLAFDPTPKRMINPPLNGPDAKRSRIRKDDLLVTIVGAGTGELCRVPAEYSNYFVCQSVALVRLKEPEKARLLELFFNTDAHGGGEIAKAIYGQGRPHLSFADLRALTVPDPDQAIARQIVDKIERAFAWIDRLASEAKSARNLIDHLDQATLAKAFRGELVPHDPDDEPTGVLLERIRGTPMRARRSGRAPQSRRQVKPRRGR